MKNYVVLHSIIEERFDHVEKNVEKPEDKRSDSHDKVFGDLWVIHWLLNNMKPVEPEWN